AAFGALLDEWTRHFAELDIDWIAEGAILLHRREGDDHVARLDSADPDALEPASDQIERVFRAIAAPEGAPLSFAEHVRFEHELDARGVPIAVRVRLDEGTRPSHLLSPARARRVAALDLEGQLADDLLYDGFLEVDA